MERILIADDVAIDRAILVALLGDEYEITEACNGREVVDVLKKDSGFACLLLDIKMPELDGIGVMDWMRGEGLLSKIPVIALTGLTEAADQIRCYEAGVSDLLEKPYNQEVLRYKIKFTIDKFRKMAAAYAEQMAQAKPLAGEVALRHLQEELGLPAARARQIVEKARTYYAELSAQLSAMTAPYDCTKLREITHILIGNSQNLGYTALYEEAMTLNACAHAEMDRGIEIGIHHVLLLLASF